MATRKSSDKGKTDTQAIQPAWDPKKTAWTPMERQALLERAEHGDMSVRAELRAMFNAHPNSVRHLFDPAETALTAIAREVAPDKDLLLPELTTARGAQLRGELEGPTPTPLERVLCERVVACWLACQILDACQPKRADGRLAPIDWREHHDRQKSRAHERLLSATLTLAKVRRLLRPEVQQVNIAAAGAQQLNVANTGAPRLLAPEPPSPLPSTTGTSQPVSASATEAATHGATTAG